MMAALAREGWAAAGKAYPADARGARRDPDPVVPSGRAPRRRMTSLRELNQDFRDLLLASCAEGVEFLIVGDSSAVPTLKGSTGDGRWPGR